MITLEDLSAKHAQFFLKVTSRFKNPDEKKPKELRLDLEPLLTKENVLAAKSIHVRGKLLVFEDAKESVQVDLWALVEDRPPIVYRDVDVQKGFDLSEDVRKYLLVRPVRPGHSLNKRSAFRVRVGQPCMIHAHQSKATFQGIVKDVSSAGFAVEVKNINIEDKLPPRETLLIEFKDPILGDKKISVEGSLVRQQASGKVATLFGCQCRDVSKDYLNYVMKKQTKKSHA